MVLLTFECPHRRPRQAHQAPCRPPQQSQKVMKTQRCSILSIEKSWKHNVFQWFGNVTSESKVMNPQKISENLRFFNVFSAQQTFAMRPRMTQALKKQENSMFFHYFLCTNHETQWFYLLFCAPSHDLTRPTGAQNGPDATKNKKTQRFSTTFMQKSRKLNGFTYFLVPLLTTSPGSPGSLSTAATISKSNENAAFFPILSTAKQWKHQVFQWFGSVTLESKVMNPQFLGENLRFFCVFFCATDFYHGAQNDPGAQKPRKLNVFLYFLCKNTENSMVLPTFLCKDGPY